MHTPHQASARELKERLEAERAGEPFLVYFDGDGSQHIIKLGGHDRLTIGRTAEAQLRVHWDPQVSRLHAEIEHVGEHWVVSDYGLSRNGTFVNEERVTGRRRLADGDVIRIGRTAIMHRLPAGPPEPSTLVDDRAAMAASVSPAQRRVLVALCRPFRGGASFATPATNPQIAAELFLSVPAVKTHLRALFHKFEIEDLPQQEKRQRLVAIAFSTGLVSERELSD